ncbi:HAMP domain-containing histidine kinase [Virgibacillus sp. NKC19-16]|uniref:sensor histidine kinase n=1 Tax=Virgibacillus salidurans TaxID=2831673 RepID=UPI001F2BB85A|nr:HAMP domain-containing sensor histidine kinase [Virgibacillus sp. NKC19-16]UJL46771.1 HAMP domain-containing histidine kinase [Virgibacillus sp. NKC19-16]
MFYITIIVTIIAVLFLIRIFSLKKEMKNITDQLKNYNRQTTNKKIDMILLDKDMEKLGTEVNHLIDLYVQENSEKTRFENELKQAVANMSHDLRTPLTSILGYIQLAESDDVTDDERREYLSIATKRAKRLETLLNDFFELSVIESMDYQLKSERINIKNLTVDILMSFFDRFKDNNIEPIINISDHDIFITSDQSAVTRVIENLIINAITHSTGNITISLEEKESTASFTIRNAANNLTEDEVDRLFDRFYMADQTRSGKGTGLGFSIVKSLMLKMNGEISAGFKDEQLIIHCSWQTSI